MKQAQSNTINAIKEAELAKRLVSDDAKERSKCLQEIERLISSSKIQENQFRKIWKALFYGLWAADKMKIQMDVAMRCAKMVHLFESFPDETMLNWTRACFEIFHREWDKLDYWRTSKFLSLARFCLNEIYVFLEKKNWNGKLVKEWNQVLIDYILAEKLQEKSTGLTLHMLQVFVESLLELNNPPYKVLKAVLEPFVEYLAVSKDKALKSRTVEFVFKLFVKNLSEGQFTHFDAHKYASYLLKRASAKEVNEANRKFLYTIQKEFLHFVAPENPMGVNLSGGDDEELGDEGIEVKILPKNGTPKEKKKGKKGQNDEEEVAKKPKAGEKKAQQKNEKKEDVKGKKEEKGKLNKKIKEKEEEKKKNTNKNATKNNKKAPEPEEDDDEENGEADWEDDDDEEQVPLDFGMDDDEDDEEDEIEEEEVPKGKKGKDANKKNKQEKKGAKGKAKEETDDKGKKASKRGRNQVVEEEEDDDLEELPEDWDDDEEFDESMIEGDEEISEDEYIELLNQQGLLGKLPPYLFQTPKEQRAFFEKVNTDYHSKLSKEKKRAIEHQRKVNFQVNKNTVKEFNKLHKVADAKAGNSKPSPGKSILKKKSTIVKATSSVKTKPAKKEGKKKVKI